MQSFQWGENFLTGLTDVDDQHHKLVDLINQFGDLLSENELKVNDINILLRELADYSKYHFTEEEEMMRSIGIDPRHFNYQKQEHDSFIEQVLTMSSDVSLDSTTEPKQLLNFLIHWLAYHILGVDQNMAEQVRCIETGMTPEEAYIAAERNRSQSTGPLLTALTELFQQLSERNKALLELNKTLEAKVQERTQALTEANSQLEHFAMTDVLTELPNRRYAMSLLRQLWNDANDHQTALVCMMIDADGFKQINDKYGHDAGDRVLQALAQELKHKVRNDDYVCRLGGDEFLIVCTDTRLEGGIHLAQLVRKAVSNLSVQAGEGIWQGSISMGVAARTAAMANPDDLLKAADEGVYLAKRDGRNCVRSCQAEASA
jgi:hemerythrin